MTGLVGRQVGYSTPDGVTSIGVVTCARRGPAGWTVWVLVGAQVHQVPAGELRWFGTPPELAVAPDRLSA